MPRGRFLDSLSNESVALVPSATNATVTRRHLDPSMAWSLELKTYSCRAPSTVTRTRLRVGSLDCRLAFQLETKFDEESDSSGEVVEDNADVLHPPNRHVPIAPSPSRSAIVCRPPVGTVIRRLELSKFG